MRIPITTPKQTTIPIPKQYKHNRDRLVQQTADTATIFLDTYVLEVTGVLILSDSRFQYLILVFTPRNWTREQ